MKKMLWISLQLFEPREEEEKEEESLAEFSKLEENFTS